MTVGEFNNTRFVEALASDLKMETRFIQTLRIQNYSVSTNETQNNSSSTGSAGSGSGSASTTISTISTTSSTPTSSTPGSKRVTRGPNDNLFVVFQLSAFNDAGIIQGIVFFHSS